MQCISVHAHAYAKNMLGLHLHGNTDHPTDVAPFFDRG